MTRGEHDDDEYWQSSKINRWIRMIMLLMIMMKDDDGYKMWALVNQLWAALVITSIGKATFHPSYPSIIRPFIRFHFTPFGNASGTHLVIFIRFNHWNGRAPTRGPMRAQLLYVGVMMRCQRKMARQTWKSVTLQETNISPKNGILKMIFLFPRWDMLIPWRVLDVLMECVHEFLFTLKI